MHLETSPTSGTSVVGTYEIVTYETDPAILEEMIRAAQLESLDTVYMVHSYGTDDWQGTGTPYRSLAAAIQGAKKRYEGYGPWADATEVYRSDWYREGGGYPTEQEPGKLWFPLTYEDEPLNPMYIGDDHPYIQKVRVQG